MPADKKSSLQVGPSTDDRPPLVVFWVMLAVALWSWGLSWQASILDRHEFRQTQTAISAYWIRQDGYRLDYETPLFGPPWSIPMEFPVYQWCVAQLSRITALPLEASGRTCSILLLLATLPAVYQLARLAGLSRGGRLLVIATTLSSPTYLFYGRTFMIETTALCFAAWFLLGLAVAVRDLSPRWSVLAALCGALAALAKITTFVLYCFPAAAIGLWFGWSQWKSRHGGSFSVWKIVLLAGLPILFASAVGAWWVIHSDTVKATNPFSLFLTSSATNEWNWGTLDQRFSSVVWHELWTNLFRSVLSLPSLLIAIICALVVRRRWRWWAASCAISFLIGPVLFPNLYYRHDYYYSANSLLLLFGTGLLLAAMWAEIAITSALKWISLVLFFGFQLLIFYQGHGFHHRRELPLPPELAQVIRQTTGADEVVLIYGWDWNSLIPYYAERRAIMAPGGREYEFNTIDAIAAKLPPRRIAAMVINRATFNASLSFIQNRAARFGFHPTPFATSPDGELYLPKESFAQASQAFAGQKLLHTVLHPPESPPSIDDELVVSDLSSLDLSAFSPRPTRSRSLFKMTVSGANDRMVLDAHAPSKLWFAPPAGATRIEAEFGMSDGSYTGEAPFSDGVGVTVSEMQPGGTTRVLFRRVIDPVHHETDRGTQKISVTAATPLAGEVVFEIDPGPKGSPVKDWAYWSKIEIR